MRLSFDWLSDYVDLSGLTPEEVAEKLTMGAFEVEEIERVGPDIQGDVVVGEILAINPHPQADKIRITTTRISDSEEPRQIVCGAWNIEVGHKIPVALPGSKVIDRKSGGALEIKESKIRGEISRGMLCSPPELGVTGDGEGILILPADTKVGTNAKELLNLTQDAVLHVEPRSNRGDALSVIGMAREVAALFGRPLREPQWKLPAEADGKPVEVSIENPEDCPFFTVRRLSGVKVGPSPAWLVRRLEAIGVRPVNNVVDITNYVMHELGQPLHAYDVAQVAGERLQVRRARSGEQLTTLDDKERSMTEEALAIVDGKGITGVAGVMGGKGSEISDTTAEIALEAAAFNSARVRRSSRLLGLSSDSSLRFERGVDMASVRKASDRASFLIVEHCGAKLGPLATAGSDQSPTVNLMLRLSAITRLTELEVSAAQVEKLLTPLGFKVKTNANEQVAVDVPSFRQKDVTREVDLVEEVCRLYGYDKVPVSMPKRTVAPPLPDKTLPSIKDALAAAGLNEAWISSLVSLEDINRRGAFEADESTTVKVLNALSEDHQVLRQSLLPGLLKAVAYNQDRGQADVWLFESGLIYARKPDSSADRFTTGTIETPHVAAIISGHQSLSAWSGAADHGGKNSERPTDFYVLKGILENMLNRLSIPLANVTFASDMQTPNWFHPSRSAKVLVKQSARDKAEPALLGWLGEVHPAVAEAYGLKKPACIFEVNVNSLKQAATLRQLREIYTTPTVQRDLTADVDRGIEHAAAQTIITQCGGKLLQDVQLVSIFDLSDEKKSLSYRLAFQHPDQTLTAEQVEEVMSKVRQQLARQLSATFRI